MAEWLTPLPCSGRLWCLRARPADWLEALAPGLASLPCSRFLQGGQALWMRLGPDEWWCWTGEGDEKAPADGLISQVAGSQPHAWIEIGDAHQAFLLQAPVQDILSQGCDLDVECVPGDLATRTRCAGFTVVICPQTDGWWLWVEASLGQSFEQWLRRASAMSGA